MLAKVEFYGLSGITDIKRPQTDSCVLKVREVIYLIYCTCTNRMTPQLHMNMDVQNIQPGR